MKANIRYPLEAIHSLKKNLERIDINTHEMEIKRLDRLTKRKEKKIKKIWEKISSQDTLISKEGWEELEIMEFEEDEIKMKYDMILDKDIQKRRKALKIILKK